MSFSTEGPTNSEIQQTSEDVLPDIDKVLDERIDYAINRVINNPQESLKIAGINPDEAKTLIGTQVLLMAISGSLLIAGRKVGIAEEISAGDASAMWLLGNAMGAQALAIGFGIRKAFFDSSNSDPSLYFDREYMDLRHDNDLASFGVKPEEMEVYDELIEEERGLLVENFPGVVGKLKLLGKLFTRIISQQDD